MITNQYENARRAEMLKYAKRRILVEEVIKRQAQIRERENFAIHKDPLARVQLYLQEMLLKRHEFASSRET